MFHLEILEGRLETIAIGRGRHQAHMNRRVVLKPGITHQDIFLIIVRIEDLDRIEPADRLDPNIRHLLVQRDHAPVRSLVRHDSTQVKFPIDILDTGLDVVLMIDAKHDARLVETTFIVAHNLRLHFELAAIGGIVERRVVDRKAIVRDTPIVTLRGNEHREPIPLDLPTLRLIEPVHFLERLRQTGLDGQDNRQAK